MVDEAFYALASNTLARVASQERSGNGAKRGRALEGGVGSKRQRVKKRHIFKIRDVNGKTYTLKRKPRKNRKNR